MEWTYCKIQCMNYTQPLLAFGMWLILFNHPLQFMYTNQYMRAQIHLCVSLEKKTKLLSTVSYFFLHTISIIFIIISVFIHLFCMNKMQPIIYHDCCSFIRNYIFAIILTVRLNFIFLMIIKVLWYGPIYSQSITQSTTQSVISMVTNMLVQNDTISCLYYYIIDNTTCKSIRKTQRIT